MKVIQLPKRLICPRCDLADERPHGTLRDCLRALDAELKILLHRSRTLTDKRVNLLTEWLQIIREEMRPAWQSGPENGYTAELEQGETGHGKARPNQRKATGG